MYSWLQMSIFYSQAPVTESGPLGKLVSSESKEQRTVWHCPATLGSERGWNWIEPNQVCCSLAKAPVNV